MMSKMIIATLAVVLFGVVAAGPVAEPEPKADPGFIRGFGGGLGGFGGGLGGFGGGFGGHGFGYGAYRGKRSPVAEPEPEPEAEPGFIHRGFGGGFGGFGGGFGGHGLDMEPTEERGAQ
ncbi:heterogeneous nuclear ribonucleoprotein A3 homolog 1-like [Macrobrachium rosenbergii]|uniref:heterogeneous nuclear ribonucleoprotein A3 homolog 1-like n=1 Tax=Macrobrachium rosenbergii TaxID=79674 RepID=UPI0034D770CC